jgi:clan AA aspartic protease
MALIYSDFVLRNPCASEPAAKAVRALLDTGTNVLCIPPTLAEELQLGEVEKRHVKLADGGGCWVPYVGPVELLFRGRHCFLGALVFGDEVRVGVAAIEDMRLVLDFRRHTVVLCDVPYLVVGVRG